MTFGKALEKLKLGGSIARIGWSGRNMWLKIATSQSPENSDLSAWIGIMDPDKKFFPWAVSHRDLLADDWYSVSN